MTRDFSQAKKEEMFRALAAIEDQEWKPFLAWCGGKVAEFGEWPERLGITSYTRRMEEYRDRILEVNDDTRKRIEAVFEGAAEIDRRYAEIFREYAETVRGQVRKVEWMMEYLHSRTKLVLSMKKPANKRVIPENDNDFKKFVRSMEIAYGFDEMTARAMLKLYEGLEKMYGNRANQVFFATMATFSYGEIEGIKNTILWFVVADIIPVQTFGYALFEQFGITEVEYEHMKNQVLLQHMLCEMPKGSSVDDLKDNKELNQYLNARTEEDFGILFEDFSDEVKRTFYEYYFSFCNKADFTHMCATSATILHNGKLKDLGVFSYIFNGIFSVDANAGYAGDLYGMNGKNPEMGNADYMADLDAVNLSNRVKNGKRVTEAISEYYVELDNGKTNRAKEFKYNIGEEDGLALLFMEAMDHFDYLDQVGISPDSRRDLVKRFFISISNEYNYLYEGENK